MKEFEPIMKMMRGGGRRARPEPDKVAAAPAPAPAARVATN
jgi:hypothetical protein